MRGASAALGTLASGLRRLSRRLNLPDAQQYLALYLIALLFVLLASWPTTGVTANDSWSALAYTRAALLGLLGLGYGVVSGNAGRSELRATAAMLLLFALLALPLEVAAFAASYPATPLSWVLVLPGLTVLAMFAVGLLLGRGLALIRAGFLAPLVVPAVLVGMVAFDVGTGIGVLNPFTGAVKVSLPHLAVLSAAVVALVIASRARHGEVER